MTWAEFKQEMEQQGVKDHHKIAWIDVSWPRSNNIHAECHETLSTRQNLFIAASITDKTSIVCVSSSMSRRALHLPLRV